MGSVSDTADAMTGRTVGHDPGSEHEDMLYRIRNLSKSFPVKGGLFRRKVGEVRAVQDISLDIHRGETVGVLGESGCGKTTLGRVLTLLEKPTAGSMDFDMGAGMRDVSSFRGIDMFQFRRRVQMIFQDPYTAFNPRQRVGDAFDELLRVHGFRDPAERARRVEDACAKVNIRRDYLARYPHEFSGGQRQRLCIARCLTINPQLVIADEVVSALDVSIQAQVVNILKKIQRDTGVTFVFISHDVSVVQYMSQRVVVMYLGEIMEIIDAEDMHLKAEHPYTQALLSAVPTMDASARRERIMLTGEIPSPIDKPPGCPFSSRCPHVMDVCRTTDPPLRRAASGAQHLVACHLDTPPPMNPLSE